MSVDDSQPSLCSFLHPPGLSLQVLSSVHDLISHSNGLCLLAK